MAHREEDLGSESKTINAVVNALAEQAAHASASEESVNISENVSFQSTIGKYLKYFSLRILDAKQLNYRKSPMFYFKNFDFPILRISREIFFS